ncbi:MAG: ribosome silencing factor [Dehalococcoidia bacterium]|nr:ribosome silencing factor [Dehalococcoidia bacterium]
MTKVQESTEGLELAKLAAEAASQKQAQDIILLDLTKMATFADYFVICSGETNRQIEAIREEIDQTLSRAGLRLLHQEGGTGSGWLLMDFGDVVVHIFEPGLRQYYGLDRFWENAVPLLRML